MLCNGTNVDATTLGFTATKKRTRFRVLNASPSDILTLQRSDGGTLARSPPTRAISPRPPK